MEQDIDQRLTAIENKMNQIQETFVRMGVWKENKKPSVESTPPPTTNLATSSAPAAQPIPSTHYSPPIKTQSTDSSGNWLGVVAVVCFVLAAGYIIKLAIDSGWLTPARQIGLAATLGLALIAAGLRLLRKNDSYFSFLPAAGVIILFLCAYAAHGLYALVSVEQALAMVGIVAGICVVLFQQIRHDIYAITAATGAYIAPVFLTFKPESHFTSYYFLVCSLAFAIISIGFKSRTFVVIAAYLALGINATVGLSMPMHAKLPIYTQALHFIIFSLSTVLYSIFNKEKLTKREAWIFCPILLFFYATEYSFIDRVEPNLAPWISLGFAAFIVAIYMLAKSSLENAISESGGVVSLFTGVVLFHSLYLVLIPDKYKPILFIVFACALLIGWKPKTNSASGLTSPMGVMLLLAGLVMALEYAHIIFSLIDGERDLKFIIFGAMSAALLIGITIRQSVYLKNINLGETSPASTIILIGAHVLAASALYRLTEPSGSIAVSASWLLYAVAILLIGFARKDAVFARSSLFILGFAVVKVLLYDTSDSSSVVRIVCLLITGAVLYACGYLLKIISRWKV